MEPDPTAPAAHEPSNALARSLLGHLINTPLGILLGAVDELEGSLDPSSPEPRVTIENAGAVVDDARLGLDRLRGITGALLSALGPSKEQDAPTDATGKILVVTGDVGAAAAICGALHGQRVTVCNGVASALRAVERPEPFEAIFCDASVAIVWLLVRVAHQRPPARTVFLLTEGSDPQLRPFLAGRWPVITDVSVAPERIRALARGD